MLSPTALTDVERMVARFRPIEGDATLRVILAGILAQKLTDRPVWLYVAGPYAPDLLELVATWRFSAAPEDLSRDAMRATVSPRRRRIIIVPRSSRHHRELFNRKYWSQIPVIAGDETMLKCFHDSRFMIHPGPSGKPLDAHERADRDHHRRAAARAVSTFLDAAFRAAADSLPDVEISDAQREQLAAADRLAHRVVCSRSTSAAELEQLVRVLAFFAGRRRVSEHEMRLALAIARSRVSKLELHALGVIVATGGAGNREIRPSWGPRRADMNRILRSLVRRGVVDRHREGNRDIYTASEQLRETWRAACGIESEQADRAVPDLPSGSRA